MMQDYQAYQARVVQEKEGLDNKRASLGIFMGTETFTALREEEKFRLRRQYEIMREYSTILGERIAAFSQVK